MATQEVEVLSARFEHLTIKVGRVNFTAIQLQTFLNLSDLASSVDPSNCDRTSSIQLQTFLHLSDRFPSATYHIKYDRTSSV
jgi:hypothetical protein